MVKSEEKLFFTEICEQTHLRKNMLNAFSGLHSLLQEPGYIVEDKNVTCFTFSEVINSKGCLYLKGIEIKGESLQNLYTNFLPPHSFNYKFKIILNLVHRLIQAGLQINDKFGFFPSIILNGVYIDIQNNIIVFLPFAIINYINRFKDLDNQRVLFYCINQKKLKTKMDETAFTESVSYLIYLFITKQEKIDENPVLDIKNLVPDVPQLLSNALWNNLHHKIIPLKEFYSIIEESIKREPEKEKKGLPFHRTKIFILFRHKILNTFRKRGKLILVLIIIIFIFSYFSIDYINTRQRIDYTAGLNPGEVVKLYFNALEDLKLDIVEYIFHRRANRDIINELSTLYVMNRLNQVYIPETTESPSSMENIDIYNIQNLEIKQISNDKLPIFSARFIKVINSGEKISKYREEQLIYLKQYNNNWYIIKVNREIVEIK